jgi:hypothetical protein
MSQSTRLPFEYIISGNSTEVTDVTEAERATYLAYLDGPFEAACPACQATWEKEADGRTLRKTHADECRFVGWLDGALGDDE